MLRRGKGKSSTGRLRVRRAETGRLWRYCYDARAPMSSLSTILALLIAIAGWYYLFYSRAADRLAGMESRRLNKLRVWLRRAGGFVMLLLAPLFFAGFHTVDSDTDPDTFVAIWVTVTALLALTVLLALVDVGLTWKLRRTQDRLRSEP